MSNSDCTTEVWRPVVGYETLYAVSNMGRVKRLVNMYRKLAGSIVALNIRDKNRACKYMTVGLNRPGLSDKGLRSYAVHRLVAAAFIGDPSGFHVNHLNGDGTDNRVANLEICTAKQNTIHARQFLGRGRGSSSGRAKINEDTAGKIKRMIVDGVCRRDIMAAFGITKGVYHSIKAGHSWMHVTIRRTRKERQQSETLPFWL